MAERYGERPRRINRATGLYLNRDVLKLVKVIAALEDTSVSALANEALRRLLLERMGYPTTPKITSSLPDSTLQQITQIVIEALPTGRDRLI